MLRLILKICWRPRQVKRQPSSKCTIQPMTQSWWRFISAKESWCSEPLTISRNSWVKMQILLSILRLLATTSSDSTQSTHNNPCYLLALVLRTPEDGHKHNSYSSTVSSILKPILTLLSAHKTPQSGMSTVKIAFTLSLMLSRATIITRFWVTSIRLCWQVNQPHWRVPSNVELSTHCPRQSIWVSMMLSILKKFHSRFHYRR